METCVFGSSNNLTSELNELLRRNLRATDMGSEAYLEPKRSVIKAQLKAHKKINKWPPTSVVDNVADAQNRVIVIGVNCGFIGENMISAELSAKIIY